MRAWEILGCLQELGRRGATFAPSLSPAYPFSETCGNRVNCSETLFPVSLRRNCHSLSPCSGGVRLSPNFPESFPLSLAVCAGVCCSPVLTPLLSSLTFLLALTLLGRED